MRRTSRIITTICILVLAVGARAAELHVPDDYNTIQAAIDAAYDGDTVIVADGTYTGTGNRDIDFLGKAITVRSESGPENCIIDCNGTEEDQHRGLIFRNNEGPESLLTGFTITNAFDWDGGAIRCFESSPTIENCIFSNNTSGGTEGGCGGGISCWEGSPTITNCTFNNNTVGSGGGICCSGSSPTIANCTFTNNTVKRGGGIYCSHSNPIISNCKFTGNSAKRGGGIYCGYDSSPTITNCTISGNSARDGGGIYAEECDITVNNSILWFNTAALGNEIYLDAYYSPYGEFISEATVSYSDVEAGTGSVYVEPNSILNWGQGNIDADPCFTEVGYWDVNGVWVDGDYHLLPNSPCIDAGDPNYVPEPNETDLDGNPRVIGGRIDMGAYEYIPPLVAQVRISPSTLNLQSKGRWVSCYIVLPEDYNVAGIDPNSILLEDEIAPDRVVLYGRLAVAKFSRSALLELLGDLDTPSTVELLVSGRLNDGTIFEGTDIITIKRPPMIRKSIKEAQTRRLRRNNKSTLNLKGE